MTTGRGLAYLWQLFELGLLREYPLDVDMSTNMSERVDEIYHVDVSVVASRKKIATTLVEILVAYVSHEIHLCLCTCHRDH
jgi:hypothetical protein